MPMSAEDDLMPEVEADAPLAHPADEAMDGRAILELDDDGLSDTRHDLAFDHRAARRDIDHRDVIFLLAKGDDCAIDDSGEAILAPLIDDPALHPGDQIARQFQCPVLQP